MRKKTVAIIGRPNVGKSSLFNIMTKTRKSIVDNVPGVTRDTLVEVVEHEDSEFVIIDTGGFETKNFQFQPFSANLVWQQTVEAIRNSDLVLCMFDGKAGVVAHDKELVRVVRELQKPTLFLVNKIDFEKDVDRTNEFYELGIEEYTTVSAAHNRGIYELCDTIVEKLYQDQSGQHVSNEKTKYRKLAIVGRPNVGKSTILNKLAGQNRSIVSEVSGTTRDPVDCVIKHKNTDYKIIDTAGMRRRSKISDKLEIISSIKSFQTIQNTDIVILVIDPIDGFNDHDARLIGFAMKSQKPVLIVVNKWDLFEEKSSQLQNEIKTSIRRALGKFAFIPCHFISCKENFRVHKILEEVEVLWDQYEKRIATSKVNEVLQALVSKHSPAMHKGLKKRPKFYYATQVGVMPPRFVIKCNVAEILQESYKKFVKSQFKEKLQFSTIPIKLIFKDKKASKQKKSSVK